MSNGPSRFVTITAALAAAVASAAAFAGGMGPDRGKLRVRVTAAVGPCVQAAARAYEKAGGRAIVETGDLREAGTADVLVGAAAEVTRALESGAAAPDSDAEVARVRWVLVVPTGNPYQVHRLADTARAGIEVWVAGGAAAHAARRAAQDAAPGQLREASDGSVPSGAAAALAPACLTVAGERLPTDVPDLVVEAAVSAAAKSPEAARGFVAFLASPAGRSAFAPAP